MNTRQKAYKVAKELKMLKADKRLDMRVKFDDTTVTICCEHVYEKASFEKIEDAVYAIIVEVKNHDTGAPAGYRVEVFEDETETKLLDCLCTDGDLAKIKRMIKKYHPKATIQKKIMEGVV